VKFVSGEKVGELHMCLWCGDKSKVYLETKAVQQHMVDKGHCKLLHEGDAFLEYTEFFDYRYLSFFSERTIYVCIFVLCLKLVKIPVCWLGFEAHFFKAKTKALVLKNMTGLMVVK